MKINRLEAHDRLLHLKKDQSVNIFRGAEDCLKRNPNAVSMQEYFPYIYIFAHPRTADDGVTKRLLWQPRLLKPKAQENSYLFRALSKTDVLQVIWVLPPKEMWAQYKKGNVTESEAVLVSINNFLFCRKELEKPHPDDYPEEKIKIILRKIQEQRRQPTYDSTALDKTERPSP
jgi:hypothetical protein